MRLCGFFLHRLLGYIFFFFSLFLFFSDTMEDLTKSWSCLTLLENEGSDLRVTEEQAEIEHVLAAKFLTKRALNIDAIAKTFTLIWRTKNRFKVQKEGDHIVLMKAR